MATSDTMSGPNDWLRFYQQNFPAPGQLSPSDATTVTTTVSATATGTLPQPLGMLNSIPSSSPPTQLSAEGRVLKPIRRRSRASRRTPTTLLNTDTTNFRAMVQQFTGGPTAPFASSPSVFPNLGFGLGSRPGPIPSGLMLGTPSSSSYHLQQQNQHYTYISSSNTNPQGGGDTFDQTLRPSNANDQGGFNLMDHGGGFFPSPNSS